MSPALAAYLVTRANFDLPSNSTDAVARIQAGGTVVFTADDIQSIRARTESFWLILSGTHKQSSVLLRFKRATAARIRDRLTSAVGERLIFVAGDKIIQEQLITDPLSGEDLQIAGSFTSEEAKSFEKTIKATLQ